VVDARECERNVIHGVVSPRPGCAGYVRAGCSLATMSSPKTFDVQLVQPDGTSAAGKYTSPDGELPGVDWVIPVDEHGTLARVTNVWPDEPAQIRAEVVDYTLDSLRQQAEEMQRRAAAGERFAHACCFCGAEVHDDDGATLVVTEGISSDEPHPEFSQMWAHKECFEQRILRGYRYFPWDEDD
jgi:hypothetical protein